MDLKVSDFIKDYGYHPLDREIDKATTMMDKVRSGEIKPIFTSLKKETDKIGGYYFSDQVVVAGRTGTGKSAKMFHDMLDFANVSLNPSYANNILILLDSYEMPGWRVVLRLISRKSNEEVKALLDYHQRLSKERFAFLKEVAQSLKGMPIYITTRPVNATDWLENKKQIQGKFPHMRLINIFDHTRLGLQEEEKREEEKITRLMIKGIELKNNFDTLNFWLSQMNRNIETGVSRDKLGTQLPVASDIFGSDAVFQCADVVLALHRPGLYGLEDFNGIATGRDQSNPDKEDDLLVECVLKQRDGWTGNILLRHDLKHNKIEDFPEVGDSKKRLAQNNLNNDDF